MVTYVNNLCMVKKSFAINWFLGMCLKENYSDSPSNEYSHLLGRVSILRRQDMNSKSGKEPKKGHHVRISTQNRVQSKKKVKIIML